MNQNYAIPRPAKTYREMAWQALKGIWGIAIVVALVAGLLSGTSGGIRVNLNVNSNEITDLPQAFEVMQDVMSSPAFVTAASISSLLSLVGFIIGGPIQVGYARFCLKITDAKRPLEFKDLFSGFDVFGEAFLLNLRITLRILGWTLLFIIPGIIAGYRYSQAFYIMAENPGLGSGECIERSKAMMQGNKWKLFCLQLSFIGWFFLTVITLGIAGLWMSPYMAVAETFFYRDVNALAASANPQWQNAGQQQARYYDPSQYYDPQTGQPISGQQQRKQDNDDFWKNY